jgi:hypothetical protein
LSKLNKLLSLETTKLLERVTFTETVQEQAPDTLLRTGNSVCGANGTLKLFTILGYKNKKIEVVTEVILKTGVARLGCITRADRAQTYSLSFLLLGSGIHAF